MKISKNHIIPATISIFCLWTLINAISQPSDLYSFISIIIGVTGIVMYYYGNKNYDKLFYFWVYMQIPNITYAQLNIMSSFPLSIGLGFGLGLKNNNNLDLYFNAFPIGIYYLVKYYNIDKSLNSSLVISRLRKGTFPQIQFPINGNIEKIKSRNRLTGIYLVSIDKEITIKDKSYNFILLEPKDNTLIDLNNKWQVCGLRICENSDTEYTDKQNPFIDWVTIQIK